MRKLIFILGVVSATLASCAPPYYSAVAFSAQVVDAVTGEAIANANVYAHWRLYRVQFADSATPVAELEIMETTTDDEGVFRIGGFTKMNTTANELRRDDPGVIVYKRGYYPGFFRSDYSDSDLLRLGANRVSTLAGTTLKLEPWKGDYAKLDIYFSMVQQELGDDTIHSCKWTSVRTFIGSIIREQARLKRDNPDRMTSSALENRLPTSCGVDPHDLKG